MTRPDIVALAVHEVGLTVDDAGIVARHDDVGDALEGVLRVKPVAGVQEDDIVAAGLVEALVHGVVDAAVGAAVHAGALGREVVDNAQRAVLRGPVHHQVLIHQARLRGYALHGRTHGGGGVVSYRNNTEKGARLHNIL